MLARVILAVLAFCPIAFGAYLLIRNHHQLVKGE